MNMAPKGPIIKALLAVLFWGTSFVATKIALDSSSPEAIVWVRFGMGVLVLGAAILAGGRFTIPEKKDWAMLVILGFLGITFHQWLQSTGLVTAKASTTSWIVSTIPIFMALLGWTVLREKMEGSQWMGILSATAGVLLVVSGGDPGKLINGEAGTMGDLLIVLSAPNWAVFSILSRKLLKKYPAIPMMFYVMVFGWFFSTGIFLANKGYQQIEMISMDGWLAIAFLGIFCSGLAYIFWYEALQSLPVAHTGAFLYLEPIVTVLVAALLLGERITIMGLIGGIFILWGVWLVNRKKGATSRASNRS